MNIATMEEKLVFCMKNHLTFPYRGAATVEDLFDASKEELDEVYGKLTEKADRKPKRSLMNKKTEEDTVNEVKISIVEYIYQKKVAESEAAQQELERRKKLARLKAIQNKRADEALENMSEEELTAAIAELEG